MRSLHSSRVVVAVLSAALAFACQKSGEGVASKGSGGSGTGTGTGTGTGAGSASASGAPAAPAQDIDSKDILARQPTTDESQVKHVLIGWKDLADVYRGHMDPRAAKRTNDEAATLAKDVYAKLKADPTQIDALVKQYSEDPGSLRGKPYTVTPQAGFVPEFKALSLRLNPSEVGIVKTQFGYHVIERVAAPPPDPLESADILARPAEKGEVLVQHVFLSWKDAPQPVPNPDPRSTARTKADADKLAKEILDKARGGADFKALMKQYSEDPGTKDSGQPYPISAGSPMPEPFTKLSLRLKEGEVGMVLSDFGWHVIKRVPPPPPDPLQSADILKRDPVTQKAKVKHILLGWTDVHAEDPRGVKRTRAELEKLVKDTVAKLQKGAKIEPLMTELSEDPGSAKSGEGYDVTPDAGLVEPFKNLSLRLKVGEVGVVKSEFGIHIIQRVE